MFAATESLFTPYPLEDYRHRRGKILAAVEATLDAGFYILGHEVAAFEQEFAAFVGCRHAIGVANGTDAIELLLRALEIGPTHQVAVPSHTAVASVSAIQRAGATPVFVDIDPETFTLDPEALAGLLASPQGRAVKAVLAVHLYGHPCAMDRLQVLCDAHGLVLLEDCAQAHGALWQGRPVGSLGRGAAFSFYPTKNLGAIGDGGAVTTDDDALAERVRCLRQYGWRERYISAETGVNSRLDELQAAILRVKLRSLGDSNAARHRLAGLYADLLGDCPEVRLPVVRAGCGHAYHLFVIRCARRDALLEHLLGHGIPAALHYPAAVHQQPAYLGIAAQSPPLPHTEEAVRTILSLPLHPHLAEEAVRLAVRTVREFITPGAVVTRAPQTQASSPVSSAKVSGEVHPERSAPPASGPNEGQSIPSRVRGVRRHALPFIPDPRGNLSVGEFERTLPFRPKRYFIIFDVPSELLRGEHAHRHCDQFLVCVRGSCAVVVDDGTHREEFVLDRPTLGLHVPPMVWATEYKYSADSALLVFASEYYDPADYIRDYQEFLSLVK